MEEKGRGVYNYFKTKGIKGTSKELAKNINRIETKINRKKKLEAFEEYYYLINSIVGNLYSVLNGGTNMNYWQVAAGDGKRDYSEVFLEYGVMLIGPSHRLSFPENRDSYKKHIKKEYFNQLRSFSEEVEEGDIVALKKAVKGTSDNTWEIVAAGRVVSGYCYKEVFSDVEGFNIQHCRYVDWKERKRPFKVKGLRPGPFYRIHKEKPIRMTNKTLRLGKSRSIKEIPALPGKLTEEDLKNFLINQGLCEDEARRVAGSFKKIGQLASWYRNNCSQISEYESRAFLIIPLLLALGWNEKNLKIEWNDIDIAFFEEEFTYETDPDDCVMILESKQPWKGLDPAKKQVIAYAEDYPNCKYVITTDGFNYKVFDRKGNNWEPLAYLHVFNPLLKHPLHPGGALEFFKVLMKR